VADTKISALTALTGANAADGDLAAVVDVSDTTQAASGTTKSMSVAELAAAVGGNGRLALGQFTTTDPSTPGSTTGVKIYTRKRAGRSLPAFIEPTGFSAYLQPGLGVQGVNFMRPASNSATITSVGMVLTANGTAAAAANWATTDLRQATTRVNYSSAATAGASGGVREAVLHYYRGNAAGRGGFFIIYRFGFNTIPATRRWFVGLVGVTTALGNAEPSSNTNIIGVGQDLADTTIQFMHGDGTAGTATRSNSAISSPATSDLLEVRIFCAPNASSIQMSVEKFGTTPVDYDSGVSTDIPANTQGLALQTWCNNGTTAAIMGMDVASIYAETNY
jgi:hypothetical protein